MGFNIDLVQHGMVMSAHQSTLTPITILVWFSVWCSTLWATIVLLSLFVPSVTVVTVRLVPEWLM